MPAAPIEMVKRAARRIADERPAVRSARPTSRTTRHMNHTRPSVLAAVIPIARCRLPLFSASVDPFCASHWIARCATHTASAVKYPKRGKSATTKTTAATASTSRSTYLGGDIGTLSLCGTSAARLYPNPPTNGFVMRVSAPCHYLTSVWVGLDHPPVPTLRIHRFQG